MALPRSFVFGDVLPSKRFVFDNVLVAAARSGNAKFRQVKSLEWMRRKIADFKISRAKILAQAGAAGRNQLSVVPGEMIFYVYDAKHKDTLPYWDAFPLIFVCDILKDGFTGLNVHYLPPTLRLQLMRHLFEYTTRQDLTPQTKMKFTYRMLKYASKRPLYKPCFKRYLYGQTRSRFIKIQPMEWTAALFLPVAQWKKATESVVWRDSSKTAR